MMMMNSTSIRKPLRSTHTQKSKEKLNYNLLIHTLLLLLKFFTRCSTKMLPARCIIIIIVERKSNAKLFQYTKTALYALRVYACFCNLKHHTIFNVQAWIEYTLPIVINYIDD